MGAEEDMWA